MYRESAVVFVGLPIWEAEAVSNLGEQKVRLSSHEEQSRPKLQALSFQDLYLGIEGG